MTTPAGWYDDGSGRQRWWDGEQWSDHYAPEQDQPSAPPEQNSAGYGVSPTTGPRPVLGFIGMGLALVGTVLAFFPITFALALGILFVAFVVSLIGVFKKNTAKWPSIVGMVLPPVGAVAGFVVVLAIIANGLSNAPSEAAPDATASSAPDAESTSEPELGDNEFPIGDGYTVEMSIEALQLDPPKGFQGAEPTQLDYDFSWDNAQTTEGQLAVVTMTIHNNNDYEAPSTPVAVHMMKPDMTEIAPWGVAQEGFDLNILNLEVPAGESQTWKMAYVLPSSEVDTVVVETFLQEDIGEGHRVTAYQDTQGRGCKQLEGSPDDPAKLWSCLQRK